MELKAEINTILVFVDTYRLRFMHPTFIVFFHDYA